MTLGSLDGENISVITLNRPEVYNALDDESGFALLQTFGAASEDDSVRCIVITGAGKAFCSGEDLGALADGYRSGEAPDLGRTVEDRYNPLIRAIRNAPKPVVAAVNGVAAGAGASIALACDFR
ncbi:MAG: 2-(1,2-epoxy,2-dihydrophenyl)acetyl-CoA isomerase, partial [Actinomycetota bacterium]|nr:2-(1,2-epoxy,2-dihydrophenyl)acetyl-CoA isomerase [Actinomycetota bacterium]